MTGELAGNAAKILMKALWLARLARPDILRPINDLATRVQRWTRADDKRVLRLVQYLQASIHYRLIGYIGDELDDVRLRLYVDADFAGETRDAKSSSGGYLVLIGKRAYFPLAWVSKKQTSISRSTTESEIVSLQPLQYRREYNGGAPMFKVYEGRATEEGGVKFYHVLEPTCHVHTLTAVHGSSKMGAQIK